VSDTTSPPPQFAWDWAGWWTCVFGANLPVPMVFGEMYWKSAWLGMAGGLARVFWVGLVANLFRSRIGKALLFGGAAVAGLQITPVFQLLSGLLAWWAWGELTGRRSGPWTDVDSLAVTLLTASTLSGVAFGVGVAICWLAGERSVWASRSTDPDAEPPPPSWPPLPSAHPSGSGLPRSRWANRRR